MKKISLLLIAIIIGICNVSAQTWVWEREADVTNHTYGNATTADHFGNVYVTGHFFSHHVSFGNVSLTNTDTVNSFSDFYLVKYDGNGNVIWARSAGGTNSDVGNAVTTDAAGNVYVTGKFRSPTMTVGNTTLYNNTAYLFDVFIIKYDANGNVIWAKQAGGTNEDIGSALVVDAHSNLYVTGTFKSPTITFGNFTLTNASNNSEDIFFVKYDSTGHEVMAERFGGTSIDGPNAMVIDANNNIYITGAFYSTYLQFGATALSSNGICDIFLVKLDTAGVVDWAKGVGGNNYDVGEGLCTDNAGNIFVSGYFKSTNVTFGTFPMANSGAGTADMFIAKYNNHGNVQWVRSAVGTGDD
ncbi:MAG: SBBP repeat-containing protein, partial [Bacteroidota bacterium]